MKTLKKVNILAVMFSLVLLLTVSSSSMAVEKESVLFHLKTGLKHDDAQICVAYNMIWAALDEGLAVNVLVDADAANTFKIGWLGKDAIEAFPLPDRLRVSLSKQFKVKVEDVPETYGEFLDMLHKKGAIFYINSAFLVLAKIETEMGKTENISPGFFKPITLREMLVLRTGADYYMAY